MSVRAARVNLPTPIPRVLDRRSSVALDTLDTDDRRFPMLLGSSKSRIDGKFTFPGLGRR